MTRAEEGEEHRRAAFLQDIVSIAVADFRTWSKSELGEGRMKRFGVQGLGLGIGL